MSRGPWLRLLSDEKINDHQRARARFGFPVPGGHHIRLASEGGSGETGRLCACGRALVGGDGDGDRW